MKISIEFETVKSWYHTTPSGRWYRCHDCKKLFKHFDYRCMTRHIHKEIECTHDYEGKLKVTTK